MRNVLPVVVGRNGVGDPGGVRVGVNDTDGRNVVQRTLVQQDVVLEWIHADDEVGPEDGTVVELLFEAGNFLVELIDDLGLAPAKNLLAVGNASRYPALEEMVSFG